MKEALNKMNGDNDHKLTATFSDLNLEGRNPPTYFKLTEFTKAHQTIVDIYGVPAYKEINPAFFNIVTFPFLFGIMFGDIGHGFIFLSFVCIMFHQQKNGYDFIPKEYMHLRWILLLMSCASIYVGFLYNDFFAIPIDCGSCYEYLYVIIF